MNKSEEEKSEEIEAWRETLQCFDMKSFLKYRQFTVLPINFFYILYNYHDVTESFRTTIQTPKKINPLVHHYWMKSLTKLSGEKGFMSLGFFS